MPRLTNQQIANMGGAAALPRKSGEQGLYTWDEFRDRLIAEIAAAEQAARTPPDAPMPTYYQLWLAAFEQLLLAKGICTPEQLRAQLPA